MWSGDAPVCDPRAYYECAKPKWNEYARNNEATNCNCPRQCRQLSYEYTISQAEFSDFQIKFTQDALDLHNYTLDQIKYDMCAIEVIFIYLFIYLFIIHETDAQ